MGESARAGDMDVNPTKEKQLTNHRAAAADDFERLAPPRPMSLEQALEFIAVRRVRGGDARRHVRIRKVDARRDHPRPRRQASLRRVDPSV